MADRLKDTTTEERRYGLRWALKGHMSLKNASLLLLLLLRETSTPGQYERL
jgi:hypothetical protein